MKKSNMNKRLTIKLMEELHIFDSELLYILKSHGIKNMQDLVDADLSKWNGLEQQRRIELEEAKVWYDLSRLEKQEQDYLDKPVYKEKGFFLYRRSLQYLSVMGVFTIGDLLNKKERVFSKFLNVDDITYKDIDIAVKLLECKYLDIDPEIEITEEDSMETIGDKLCFRSSTAKAFAASPVGKYKNNRRYTLTPKGFINIIKNCSEKDARERLLNINGIGVTRVDEIYYRALIVLNYAKKHKRLTHNKDLVTKYFELLEKSNKVKELDAKLDSELDSILDEMASKGLLTEEIISKHGKQLTKSK